MRSKVMAGLVGLVAVAAVAAAAPDEFKTIFDGHSADGWITNKDRRPLKSTNIQADGLNPHKSVGYIVVHEQPHGDFVLDFDYKLSPGCNSGVFIRVGELKNPVYSGIEIALDDTRGTGMHDPGAVYDLVAPSANTQKPAGEWNHMTITARGPHLEVALNGQIVTRADLDQFDKPGKRPDGTNHKFKVAIKDLPRTGYLGFQDHGKDCWFKNVRIKDLN